MLDLLSAFSVTTINHLISTFQLSITADYFVEDPIVVSNSLCDLPSIVSAYNN